MIMSMKSFVVLLLTVTMYILPQVAWGQDYNSMWKELQAAKQSYLPEEVQKAANKIYGKAKAENNYPQMMASCLELVMSRSDVDPDSFDVDIARLEKLMPTIKKASNPTVDEACRYAVTSGVLATAYKSIYATHAHIFDDERRTAYRSKAKQYLVQSVAYMEALSKAKSESYEPMTKLYEDGKLYNHDMLAVMISFVRRYAASNDMSRQEITEIMERALNVYVANGNKNAATLIRLDILEDKYASIRTSGRAEYRKELKALMDETKDIDAGADVMLKYISVADESDDAGRTEVWRLATWGMTQWPEFAPNFTNIVNRLTLPSVSLHGNYGNALAGRPVQFMVDYSNVESAELKILEYVGEDSKTRELRTDGKVIVSRHYDFDMSNRSSDGGPWKGNLMDELCLDAGTYVVLLEGADASTKVKMVISGMTAISYGTDKNTSTMIVLDKYTGRPVQGANVKSTNKFKFSKDTNAEGEVVVTEASNYNKFEVTKGNDVITASLAYVSSSDPDEGKKLYGNVMTDRSIYRPGHKVQASVLMYYREKDQASVASDIKCRVVIDNGHTHIESDYVATNKWGTADFELTIPDDAKLGYYSARIEVQDEKGNFTSSSLSVEEYKRPMFDVKMNEAATKGKTFGIGDEVELEAIASMYSGVPVQGAKVHYTIKYASTDYWNYYSPDWKSTDQSGETETDKDGRVRVKVRLDDNTDGQNVGGVVQYLIDIKVTDQSGETHSASKRLCVSKRPYMLSVSVPSVYKPSTSVMRINAYNADHNPVEVPVTYSVMRGNTKIFDGKCMSNTDLKLDKLPFGDYRLVAHGDEDVESKFTYFDQADFSKEMTNIDALPASDFFYCGDTYIDESHPADLYFAPCSSDANVYYIVAAGGKVVEKRRLTMDTQMLHRKIAYNKSWGDGASLHIFYVHGGEIYSKEVKFSHITPNRNLKLSWNTFRDHLQPGQKETWVLSVKDPDGNAWKSGAEMMATMYDASLDEIRSHYWSFGIYYPRNIKGLSLSKFPNVTYIPTVYASKSNGYKQEKQRHYDVLDKVFAGGMRNVFYGMAMPRMVESKARSKSMDGGMVAVEEDVAEAAPMMAMVANNNADNEPQDASNSILRTNFSETAFFYPHILVDKNGEARIEFTLPESLTEWKFMGLVHSTDMYYGRISSNAVASKDFMVMPNMPRFVRTGDKASIAVRIVNRSDKSISGTSTMRLLLASDEKTVVKTLTQQFSAEADATTSVTFDFDVPMNDADLVCEIIATDGTNSDGERNLMPVISTREHVVETVPFYIDGSGDKTVDLSSLFNGGSKTATDRSLHIEYTAHPAWTVFASLHATQLPDHDNAPSYSTALYSNVVMMDIAKRLQGELDNFDASRADSIANKAYSQLKSLQLNDGSFAWFKGMKGSYYITLCVADHLTDLLMYMNRNNCTFKNSDILKMRNKAMAYLTEEELKGYEAAKKQKRFSPSNSTIEYLMLMASLDPNSKKDITEMKRTYLDELEKGIKTLTIYGRAAVSRLFAMEGRNDAATAFRKSVKQYTVQKPGLGRYFASDDAYYSWRDYRIPTQIEAMRCLDLNDVEDRQYLLDMQMWLLRQKQTHVWGSSLTAISVADMLLGLSPDITAKGIDNMPVMKINGNALTLSPSKYKRQDMVSMSDERLSQNLGQMSADVDNGIISSSPLTLQFTAGGDLDASKISSVSWGYARAEFMEDIDRLQKYTSGELQIDRKIYVERKGADGKTAWMALDSLDSQVLHIGEKVRIRHIVKADRDMDFVGVESEYPACFEPVLSNSGYQAMGARYGYLEVRDSKTTMFFDWFTKGTSTIDLEFYVTRTGVYQSGKAQVECTYAPDFGGHTGGRMFEVK